MLKLTTGTLALDSFDESAFFKPNIGPDFVDSFDATSAAVCSIEETTLFPKLNRLGLAADPFGEPNLLEPKIVWVASVNAPTAGLKVGSGIDEVIEFGTLTFSSTLDPSAVPRGSPSTVQLLDGIITDVPGVISFTVFSVTQVVFSATAVETIVCFPVVKEDTSPLG